MSVPFLNFSPSLAGIRGVLERTVSLCISKSSPVHVIIGGSQADEIVQSNLKGKLERKRTINDTHSFQNCLFFFFYLNTNI